MSKGWRKKRSAEGRPQGADPVMAASKRLTAGEWKKRLAGIGDELVRLKVSAIVWHDLLAGKLYDDDIEAAEMRPEWGAGEGAKESAVIKALMAVGYPENGAKGAKARGTNPKQYGTQERGSYRV